MTSGPELKVVTLNCWGLLKVSKRRVQRMSHIGDFLENCKADVVLLQEVWVGKDAEFLLSCAGKGKLVHSIHFRSGIFGSGLITLSKHPLVEVGFVQYQAAGDPMAITCGDFFAAKGVGWVRIRAGLFLVDVFNTHLHANYSHKSDQLTLSEGRELQIPTDSHAPYRIAQMQQLTQYIRLVAQRGDSAVVLGGDLNCEPDSLEIAMLKVMLPGLVDSWSAVHPDEPGLTCKAPGNSYSPRRQRPERIDYVWTTMPVKQAEVILKQTPDGYSYSDHFGVEATLHLRAGSPPQDSAAPAEGDKLVRDAVLATALSIVYQGASRAGGERKGNKGIGTGLAIMAFGAALLLAFKDDMEPLGRIAGAFGVLIITPLALVLLLISWMGNSSQQRAMAQAASQLKVSMRLGLGA